MAKTSFILVPVGLEELRNKAISSGDRFKYSTIRRKPVSVSRKLKKKLLLRSVLPQATELWNALTVSERDSWASASVISGQKPFALFLRDVCARLKNSLSVPGVPSDIVQNMCGYIELSGSATAMCIEQLHPQSYFVNRKVFGSRDTYIPVAVIEDFVLPLEIGISWKTDLTSTGSGSFAKFYALVLSHYQGRDIETKLEINFGLSDDWQNASVTLSSVVGIVKGYAVYIECYNVQGSIRFDNVDILHSGQNWARDPECNSVNSEFTKAFAQIPRHWAPELMPDGAYFESRYYLV